MRSPSTAGLFDTTYLDRCSHPALRVVQRLTDVEDSNRESRRGLERPGFRASRTSSGGHDSRAAGSAWTIAARQDRALIFSVASVNRGVKSRLGPGILGATSEDIREYL